MFVAITSNFTNPFAAPCAPFALAAQQVVIDPTNPCLIALSQAAAMNVEASTAMVLALTDDSSIMIDLTANTICTPSNLSFYGTSHTQVEVLSNGRLMFGAPNNSFNPSVAAALTDSPSFGVWADYNPSSGGTVTASNIGGLGLAIAWANVPYFGTAITNSFILSLDASGTALCDGLTGIAVGAGPNAITAWFGISAGNLGATDPGITTFTIGGPNAGPAGMGMLYNFGPPPSGTAGINQLMLLPNSLGNYDWAAF